MQSPDRERWRTKRELASQTPRQGEDETVRIMNALEEREALLKHMHDPEDARREVVRVLPVATVLMDLRHGRGRLAEASRD